MSTSIAQAIDYLTQRYPACFNLAKPQPLKRGIRHDIHAELPAEFSHQAIHKALWVYTQSPDYLKSIVAGRPRIDLTGAPAGTVTAAEAAHALTARPGPRPPTPPAPAPSPPPGPRSRAHTKPKLGLPFRKTQ